MKHNIILIGFMGSGKTSVGKSLAERMSYQFHDMDQQLESRAGDTINQIFAVHGEEYFRNMETKLLQEMSTCTLHTVVSTGGGLPLREQNRKLIKEMGYVIYLKASVKTTVERLKGDSTRPLLRGEELEQKVKRMLELRDPIYENTAHKIIVTDDKQIDTIVHQIMEAYLKQS